MAIDVVGSKLPARNGYGQNGYGGASSDLPGQKTTSGVLPAVDLNSATNDQTRTVDDSPLPTTFGHHKA